jgi:hypothetical protein
VPSSVPSDTFTAILREIRELCRPISLKTRQPDSCVIAERSSIAFYSELYAWRIAGIVILLIFSSTTLSYS